MRFDCDTNVLRSLRERQAALREEWLVRRHPKWMSDPVKQVAPSQVVAVLGQFYASRDG